jgi:prepilin-type N-terminal cleavage/methylation domain-containing protein/prepilin-type processing-associated H-X9-DG protein
LLRSKRDGLSLIEVLVVLAIIAILLGLILPSTRRVRDVAAYLNCQNNLKQLMQAIHTFEENGGPGPSRSTGSSDEPTVRFFAPGCLGPGAIPEERLSWMVALLPYLEQSALHQQFDPGKGYAGNLPAAQTAVRTFLCPESESASKADSATVYIAMAGIGRDAASQAAGTPGNGFMGYDRRTSWAMIKDGGSNTIALTETRWGLGPWARGGESTVRGFDPTDLPLHGDGRPLGGHPKGINVALVDGSVRFIRPSIDPTILAAAITIAGGESVLLD